jgi:hypothetical protein
MQKYKSENSRIQFLVYDRKYTLVGSVAPGKKERKKEKETKRERKRGERERENSVSIDEPVQLRS